MLKHILSILLLCALPCALFAQSDSIYYIQTEDSLASADTTQDAEYQYYFDLKRQPIAARAVWLGAIVPGLGQIYNGSYWKLPIVYGGLMGCGYAISLNQTRYESYKQAYRDLYNDAQAGTVSEDPQKTYIAILPEGYDIERMGGVSNYSSTLNNRQNAYRRFRDYSIVATIVVYALSLVDAYVDASLFDFDISPDLTMNVSPQLYYDSQYQHTAELKLAIRF